ncbi:MAG: hypothetical protein AAB389_04350 [Patescibacteria group bacterium]
MRSSVLCVILGLLAAMVTFFFTPNYTYFSQYPFFNSVAFLTVWLPYSMGFLYWRAFLLSEASGRQRGWRIVLAIAFGFISALFIVLIYPGGTSWPAFPALFVFASGLFTAVFPSKNAASK